MPQDWIHRDAEVSTVTTSKLEPAGVQNQHMLKVSHRLLIVHRVAEVEEPKPPRKPIEPCRSIPAHVALNCIGSVPPAVALILDHYTSVHQQSMPDRYGSAAAMARLTRS
jgi:hypothetical protein